MKNLNPGKLYRFSFYDHSATDNGNVFDESMRPPCEITLCGWLLNATPLEYVVEVVKASMRDNSLIWHILKSAVTGVKEIGK
jgi:hypothetical protein